MAKDVTPAVVGPDRTRVESDWLVMRGNELIASGIDTKAEAIEIAKSNSHGLGVVVKNSDGEFQRVMGNPFFWDKYVDRERKTGRYPQIVMRR